MNIKQIVKYIFITILVSIFVIFPAYKFINPTPERTFEVIGKVSKPGENIVGKYHSEVVEKIYVRIQYNDGEIITKTFDDPFVAETYVVGQRYIETKDIYSNGLLYSIVIIFDISLAITLFVFSFFTTIFWFNSNRSLFDVFKNPFGD